MACNSRRKGAAGERELANKLKEYGYNCRHGVQYNGTNGDADVIGLPDIHIECKRVENLNMEKAMKQAENDARQGGNACRISPRQLSCVFAKLISIYVNCFFNFFKIRTY